MYLTPDSFDAQFKKPGDRIHTIYQYTGSVYKIVQLYRSVPAVRPGPGAAKQHHDYKLQASVSRSRRVLLELALCNPWDYFVTLTLSPVYNDRFDLDFWYKRFYRAVEYEKKAHDLRIKYVIVPERHKDGAWHAHGLFRGNMDLIPFSAYKDSADPYPVKLLNSDYLDWPWYSDKFGGCSFGPIRDSLASGFYMTKYISKELASSVQDVGKHLYYASHGLNRAGKMGHILFRSDYVDSLLYNKYEYCSTGIVQPHENWDSHFVGMLLDEFALPEACPFDLYDFKGSSQPSAAELEADVYYQDHFDIGSDLRFF